MPTLGKADDAADPDLLTRAAAGDLDAFGVLYERYQQVAFRFACGMTGSRDAAADICHDAFLTVLAEAGRFDPRRAALSTYLYGVVRNLCRERLRRTSRLQLADAAALARRADPALTPPDLMVDAEQAALVREALAELPSRYRELVLLCDVHDRSYAEAAQIVGTSVPAVRSRLHRGRQQLKSALAARLSPTVTQLRPARCAV
jgi:RNA polymerase sigma-70 factor (ECF subfamily)